MSNKELVENIKIELKNLERLNKEMEDLLPRIKEKLTFVEIRAAAGILHDFYSGAERIFERIALSIDKNLPKGENWHIELLSQIAKPFTKIRKSVISENLFEKLQEYMKFRHLCRHLYEFELKWDRIKPLCFDMENVLNQLRLEMNKFLEMIEKEE